MSMDDGLDIFDDVEDVSAEEGEVVVNSDEDILDDSNIGDEIFEEKPSANKDDLLEALLADKGIKNNKVVIINEDDTQEEVDFSSLSLDERLEILKTPTEAIDDETMELVDYLKINKLSLGEYLDNYKQAILSEITPAEEVYEVDAYTDEELYILDLKNKYDDLTDEELLAELEKELGNKDLFARKVNKLRSEYKEYADNLKVQQEQEVAAASKVEYDKFANTMVNVATKTADLYGIELEDSEKNDVLAYLLELDNNGVSKFYKTLQDPNQLYKAAWFLKYGKEAFDAIHNEYEAQIKKIKKDSGRK